MNRAISRRYNTLPKVVISDRGPVSTDNAWAETTRVVSRDEAAVWVSEAKETGAGDIVVFGSRRTWNGLLARGLVDELHLMVSPTVLGDGVGLFTTPASLDLVDCRRYEGSANVQLRYRVLTLHS